MLLVAPRLSSLLDRPIGFAHRGARAHAPENTLEAFHLARRLGATGLESDVWITADGVAVLDHDGVVGAWPRRKAMSEVPRSALPDHIPSLEEFYDDVGTDLDVSLDVKDAAAFDAVVAVARAMGAEERLWLCHPQADQLAQWREHTEARLVDSTRLSKMPEGPERRADKLRSLGIDAVNLRYPDWTGGMIAMFHRFDRLTLGWGAQQPREIATLIDAGIDGVFSDHSDRLAQAMRQFFPDDDLKDSE